jgi:hypothetical protein
MYFILNTERILTMHHFYSNLPCILSAIIIICAAYPLVYFSLSKKKYTAAEEKAIKRVKKLFPIVIILAILNIISTLFF